MIAAENSMGKPLEHKYIYYTFFEKACIILCSSYETLRALIFTPTMNQWHVGRNGVILNQDANSAFFTTSSSRD
jgi:hypothetical protein